jgi:hypothetical protein
MKSGSLIDHAPVEERRPIKLVCSDKISQRDCKSSFVHPRQRKLSPSYSSASIHRPGSFTVA